MKLFNLGWLPVVMLLPGCMPGPHYKQPVATLPNSYTSAQLSGVQTTSDLSAWWRYFHDCSLNDLIKKAITTNYDLRLAIEKIEETRAAFQIQTAQLFPDSGALTIVQRIRQSNLVQNAANSRDKVFSFFNLGFYTFWELDFWGKLRRSRNAAYAEYEAQIEAMRDVYIVLLSDVATAYINSRSLQEKIDLTTSLVQVNQQLIFLLGDRYTSGLASEIPITQEQQELATSNDQLIVYEQALKRSITNIAVLLGTNPEDFVLVNGEHKVPYAHEPLAIGLPSDLLRRRPDIRSAERLLSAATDRVGQAIAQWFPSFQLIGSVGGQTNCIGQLFSNQGMAWNIGPAITWPFLSFGRIEFNIQEKKSIMRQALLQYGKTVLDALADVEIALIIYFSTQERLGVMQEKYAAVKRQRDLTYARWTAGLDAELSYLTAEKSRIQIGLELTDIKRTLSVALVAVYKAVGGGW